MSSFLETSHFPLLPPSGKSSFLPVQKTAVLSQGLPPYDDGFGFGFVTPASHDERALEGARRQVLGNFSL